MREGRAEAVKLEGGRKRLPMIGALLDAEIPVMGHLGLTPQSFHTQGGYRVQGKDIQTAQTLLEDARALEEAGVFALVLEGIPGKLASLITERVSIPTIGIGAGIACDGQVLVFHDILGLQGNQVPRFVRQYAQLSSLATEALQQFRTDVQTGTFPSSQETYTMQATTLQDLTTSLEEASTGYLQHIEE
jgi:3-methyl-2-oxobutanoate hydroxymethyltransferase